ncbi:MAG: hypothetical protein MJ133_01850 [Lachnospiraceae bacterium]|nr:hypothetical protein [Lachnospiraceae bacterium]
MKNKKSVTRPGRIFYGIRYPSKVNLDLRRYAKFITRTVEGMGGTNVQVYKDGFSFDWKKRCYRMGDAIRLGKRLAKHPTFQKNVFTEHYKYSNGMPGVSTQLFKRMA